MLVKFQTTSLFVIGGVLLSAAVVCFSFLSRGNQSVSIAKRPPIGKFVSDHANLIPYELIENQNHLLQKLLEEADIELLVHSVETLAGETITDYADRMFQQWQIGGGTRANRGLLLVVSRTDKRVRFEVSYGLEGMYPDAFVGYIEHNQMVPYFESGLVGEGIAATIELIAGRAFNRISSGSYQPLQKAASEIDGYLSGGAGADTRVAIGAPRSSKSRIALDHTEQRIAYDAQPTPALAWKAFLEINRRQIDDTELGLYDDKVKRMLRSRPYTNAAFNHITRLYSEKTPLIKEKGEFAAVVFPEDKDYRLAPWFFRKGKQGWQIDGDMYPAVIGYNHLNQWRLKKVDIPYRFAFDDCKILKHGFVKCWK